MKLHGNYLILRGLFLSLLGGSQAVFSLELIISTTRARLSEYFNQHLMSREVFQSGW